jgi:arylsulfatase A-like enzyme
MKIFIIMLDTLRKDHVGIYGNDWIKTPNMDALANDSIIFTSAFPESLPTIPLRRSLHTGIRTFPFKEYNPRKGDIVRAYGWEPIPENQDTISEILKTAKYKTGFVTDTYHYFKPSMNFHRGYDQWVWVRGQEGDAFKSGPKVPRKEFRKHNSKTGSNIYINLVLNQYLKNKRVIKSIDDYYTVRVFSEAIKWVEENKAYKKNFLLIDGFDPHEPFDPPQEYVDEYYPNYEGRRIITPNYSAKIDYLTKNELKYMRAAYAGEVTFVDQQVGKFISKLRDMELYDDALIFLLADHGHQLGEHNMTGKIPWGLYPELMDIPFLLKLPGNENSGTRVKSFVYNHDIVSTILNYLKIKYENKLDGINLLDDYKNREHVTSAMNSYFWCRTKKYVLISDINKDYVRLFDLSKDPEQNIDIAESNLDIVGDLFEKIKEDAGGKLYDYKDNLLKKIEDWYKLG